MRRAVRVAEELARSLFEQRLRRSGRIRSRIDDADFAVATKRGLFLIRDGQAELCLAGCFYGLTLSAGALLCFQAFPRLGRGRILRIARDGAWRVVIDGLSHGCHQIDVKGGGLYVSNTYLNEILRFDLRSWRPTAVHRPLGALDRGRASANYGHLNSLFLLDDRAILLCHSETAKTRRPSELLVCDRRFQVLRRLELDAASAHNVVPWNGDFLICDSGRKRLLHGARELARLADFTRGLAVTDQVIAVGESAYASRGERARHGGCVVFLDHGGRVVERLALPGMVQEIRALSRPDHGLSQHCEPAVAGLARLERLLVD